MDSSRLVAHFASRSAASLVWGSGNATGFSAELNSPFPSVSLSASHPLFFRCCLACLFYQKCLDLHSSHLLFFVCFIVLRYGAGLNEKRTWLSHETLLSYPTSNSNRQNRNSYPRLSEKTNSATCFAFVSSTLVTSGAVSRWRELIFIGIYWSLKSSCRIDVTSLTLSHKWLY